MNRSRACGRFCASMYNRPDAVILYVIPLIKWHIMNFWQLSILGKSTCLIGASLICLALFFGIHFLFDGEFMLDSPGSIFPCLLFPYLILVLGQEGQFKCPPEQRRPSQLIISWVVFSAYLVLLTVVFYIPLLPVGRGIWVMPLGWIFLLFPFIIWQQRRISRSHAHSNPDK